MRKNRQQNLYEPIFWAAAVAIGAIGSIWLVIGLKISFAQANAYFLNNPIDVAAVAATPIIITLGYFQYNRKNQQNKDKSK